MNTPPEDETERRLTDIENWLRSVVAHDLKNHDRYLALSHANYLTDLRHSLQKHLKR